MSKARTLALTTGLVLALGHSGCGSNAPRAFSGGITISGVATLPDKQALGDRDFEGHVLLIVDGACPRETQHRAAVKIRSQADGSYQTSLVPADFVPVSHFDCPLIELDDASVRALRLSLISPADPAVCRRFCVEKIFGCQADCEASGQLRAEARGIGSSLSQVHGVTTLSLPLDFDEVSSLATGGGMADLVVDGSTLGESWKVESRDVSSEDCAYREGCLGGAGRRRLLTFDGVIANSGESDLVIGSPENHDGASFDSCHLHYHLGNLMTYELISQDGSVVATGRKQGFCLMDSTQIRTGTPGAFTCENQGISSGWADVYDRALDCQWVDVTEVPAGDYLLKLSVNPDLAFIEADYSNNEMQIPVKIPQETP